MEDAFIVEGGIPLTGEVKLSGAKNVALKMYIAALMFDSPVSFDNIPILKDIEELSHVIESNGAKIYRKNKNSVSIDPRGLNKYEVDFLHASKTRVSFMLFAPFLFKFGQANIPNPGGCRIGARPIDRIVSMMQAFGVNVQYNPATGYYNAKLKKGGLRGVKFTFNKPTHTGTELAILFACISKGKSVIRNCGLEPEIDDLINFLNRSNAKIERIGKDIVVEGVRYLKQPAKPYRIMNDRIEAVTYACFGIATKGDVTIKNCPSDTIQTFIKALKKAGAGVENDNKEIRFYYKKRLKAVSITTAPHPGFMTDWQAPWAVLMSLAKGESLLHETVFESRFGYVDDLRKLGAKISYINLSVKNPSKVYQFDCSRIDLQKNPQAILIDGVKKLHGGVVKVSDLRAGATLLIAACSAIGASVVIGASIIDRGYETIEKKLSLLGAKIKRI